MTKMRGHMGITIRYIEEMAQETGKGISRYFNNFTEEEAVAYLADLKAQGFEGVPTCDHVDAKGFCAGHALES